VAASFAAATSARRRCSSSSSAVLVRQQGGELLVALAQAGFELLQLLGALPRRGRGPGQCGGVEHHSRRRAPDAAIGAGEPVGHMEQLAYGDQRVVVRDRALAVHGAVAERVDDACLAEHRFARRLLETRLVDQRREIVLIRQLERRVVLVRPGDRQFQRPACVEAGAARVGVRRRLGSACRFQHGGPLTFQERELAHRRPSGGAMPSLSISTWRA
jgi:hypothetical protein